MRDYPLARGGGRKRNRAENRSRFAPSHPDEETDQLLSRLIWIKADMDNADKYPTGSAITTLLINPALVDGSHGTGQDGSHSTGQDGGGGGSGSGGEQSAGGGSGGEQSGREDERTAPVTRPQVLRGVSTPSPRTAEPVTAATVIKHTRRLAFGLDEMAADVPAGHELRAAVDELANRVWWSLRDLDACGQPDACQDDRRLAELLDRYDDYRQAYYKLRDLVYGAPEADACSVVDEGTSADEVPSADECSSADEVPSADECSSADASPAADACPAAVVACSVVVTCSAVDAAPPETGNGCDRSSSKMLYECPGVLDVTAPGTRPKCQRHGVPCGPWTPHMRPEDKVYALLSRWTDAAKDCLRSCFPCCFDESTTSICLSDHCCHQVVCRPE